MNTRSVLAAAFCLFTGLTAHASGSDFKLGEPGYGGTGCPGGSASVSVGPDQQSISILFDQYVVEAGGATGKSFDRKNCNIAIPVHVPNGYSVSVFAIDYRGFTGLPSGATAKLTVDYFLPGAGRGVRSVKDFAGPTSDGYLTSDSLGLQAVVWSACGADTILRTNTSMLVKSNSRAQYSTATVDSVDVQAGLIYHLQWRRCN